MLLIRMLEPFIGKFQLDAFYRWHTLCVFPSVVIFCGVFLSCSHVPLAFGLILQLLSSPIGNRNLLEKTKKTSRLREGMMQTVLRVFTFTALTSRSNLVKPVQNLFSIAVERFSRAKAGRSASVPAVPRHARAATRAATAARSGRAWGPVRRLGRHRVNAFAHGASGTE